MASPRNVVFNQLRYAKQVPRGLFGDCEERRRIKIGFVHLKARGDGHEEH